MIDKEHFPEIVSQPNWFWTWVIRVLFVFVLGLIAASFYLIPALLYMEEEIYGSEAVVFMAIYYPVILSLSVVIIRNIKRNRAHAVKRTIVNSTGIHYERINGSTASVLFSHLQPSTAPYIYDVYTRTLYKGPTLLKVYVERSERTVYFQQTDAGYTYFTGNYRTLRAHFIRGIMVFRPDLSISPTVFDSYFIDPKTFGFDKKGLLKTILLVIAFLILLLLGIEWHMRHRFGSSLFF